MRKLFYLLVAFASMGTLSAQDLNYGLKGGVNFATIGGDNIEGNKVLTGFYAGGFAEIKIVDIFAVQPEVQFSAQGSSFDAGDDLKLNYLQVPVMAKLYFFNILYVEAGPQVGFLMSAKSGSEDIKDTLNTTEVAAGLGLGVNVLDKLRVGARMTFGLTDVNKEGDGSVRNVVFQLGGAYVF